MQPARREISPPESTPNPMLVKNQVKLRAREDRDEGKGAKTAGQQRAAKELERIRREQNRTTEFEESTTANTSRRQSQTSTVGSSRGPPPEVCF